MARRGLGRGLDALIPDRTEDHPSGNEKSKKSGQNASGKAQSAGDHKRGNKGAQARSTSEEGSQKKKTPAKETKKYTTGKREKTESVERKKNGANRKSEIEKAEKENPENKNVSAGVRTPEATAEQTANSEYAEQAANSGSSKRAVNSDPAKRAKDGSEPPEKTDSSGDIEGEVVSVRISLVEPNRGQPRKYFDESAIDELADSIRQFGVIQPLLVQEKEGYYEIIAGERRWRAAKKAGLREVPVIVRHFSNQEAVEVALIENIQREDLNPMEEARAYERLVKEYGLSQEDVAGRVSKSRSAVTNSMRLLRLDSSVQKMVETSQISEGHARALLGLVSAEAQKEAAEQVVNGHLSVRQTEKLVRDANKPAKEEQTSPKAPDPILTGLAGNMTTALGTKVAIRPSGKDRGKIEIEYYSADELDRIYELILAAQ